MTFRPFAASSRAELRMYIAMKVNITGNCIVYRPICAAYSGTGSNLAGLNANSSIVLYVPVAIAFMPWTPRTVGEKKKEKT